MNKKTILGTLAVLATTTLGAFAAVPNTVVDVTNGLKIRWVVTPTEATGFAKAAYTKDDGYQLHAVLSDLDDPKVDDFYEGWVVRKSPFAFISTGKLTKESDGKWHNKYSSSIDYSNYDFYVLTLEPNDGNDAPADHILEGDVTLVESFSDEKNKDTNKNTALQKRINEVVPKLSDAKKAKLKKQVLSLQSRLPDLKISDTKREKYTEIIDLLLNALK